MHAYRAAYSNESMEAVDTFDFDKNYNNFWDPAVLKAYVTHVGETWKNSYGFSNTVSAPWDGKSLSSVDSTKCHLKCAQLVSQHTCNQSIY